MSRTIKKITAVGVAAAALAAFGPATNAVAANPVPCHSNEYTYVEYHYNYSATQSDRKSECWANAGGFMPTAPATNWDGTDLWMHKLNSGNNVVWWKADGNWNRLPKWNNLHFPNHPGGVKVTDMFIE